MFQARPHLLAFLRTPRALLLATLSVLVFAASCVGPSISAQVDVVRVDIDRARQSGAYRCAPKELAEATTHADFAATELAQGDFMRAQEHIERAVKNANAAIENSRGCGPKRVVIKKKVDTDRDGILDKVDRCPERPEDRDLFEDEDGCPDPDNDQDKVLDPLDSCPNNAGPQENDGCPYGDRDGDGINDKSDKCPDKPEDVDGDRDEDGCPDVDSDGDGIEDATDKCPTQPEDKDTFEDEDGCPDPDNDQDGILDTVDACPLEAGQLETRGCPDTDADRIADKDDKCPAEPGVEQPDNPERHGCPILDRDGDGILDKDDKCPDEPGVPQPDKPEQHGCKKKYKLIVVKNDRIEIKQQVFFATGKSRIKAKSYKLLAEVADAVKRAGIKKVRIEGHTDSRGSDATNMRLSQARANAVKTHLIELEGVSPDVLGAVGYGETRPIANNRTRSGRAKNRRVEFHIEEH